MSNQSKITVRQKQIKWPDNLPKYWHRNSVFATHYFNALSLIFPEGEKFFIESIRNFTDAEGAVGKSQDVRDFIGQEVWHSKAHTDYNAYLAKQNLPVAKCEKQFVNSLEKWKKRNSKLNWLAATVGYEHITTSMSRELLLRQDNCKHMHPHFASLWRWHTLEELEHKAVVFDLYQRVGGGYFRRTWMTLYVFYRFNIDVTYNLVQLLKADNMLWNFSMWKDWAKYLYGFKQGWFWRSLPDVLSIFRPGYHPNQTDDSALLRKTLEIMAEESAELPKASGG